jgi:hypothetical protein
MRPWTFEADNIDIRDINPDNIYQFVVPTPSVMEFLTCGSDDIKYFVIGPKGLGKTFLLKVKSKFYREYISGYHCIPSGGGELVEKLASIRESFSKEDLESFKDMGIWEKTWELSLYTMILRSFKIDLPSELMKTLGEARTLLDILSAFIQSRSAIDKLYSKHVATSLRPKVGELREHGTNQIAVFIDNIEEGIEEHARYDLKHTKGILSEDVWINAQLGMMKVVRGICQRNKHIKIFVSIRSEAFNNDRTPTALQSRDNATVLMYTRSQIKKIFEQNISITQKANLARPNAVDPIERFIGFSKMNHRFAKDADGNPRQENTFDFIFRHTFGRPREIVLMGSEIVTKVPVSERENDETAVREMINKVSSDLILQQLGQEIVPRFEYEVFDKFCELVRHNVISTEQAREISEKIYEEHGFENVFSYLYSCGLVGVTEDDPGQSHQIQRFQPVGQYSLSSSILPKALRYFVIHSSIDKLLRSKHGKSFYDQNNIIGNGLIFQEPKASITDMGSKVLHTHFGLGRDSLTLIIPELNKNKTIALIQKPSKDDHELAQAQFVEIRTGDYDPIKFKVVHDDINETKMDEAVAEWETGANVLFYSSRPHIIGKLLDLSETVTLWSSNFFGPPQEDDLLPPAALDEISAVTKRKAVYLCQRVINKKILAALKNQIKAKNLEDNISIESSLVDRLESKRTKKCENQTLIYNVEAEEYGSIISRERLGSKNQSSNIVRRTQSAKEQSYYEDRQKFLKEGIYRLTKIIKKVSFEGNNPNLDEIYELFFDIQIANLVSKHDLRQIYGSKSESEISRDLRQFCLKNKERFLKLGKFPAFVVSQDQYIRDSKRMGALPDKTFFQLARQSPLFVNSPVVLKLRDLLLINDSRDYYSVFICFSSVDTAFAKKINDSLKKRGVDTYFFKENHRHGTIKAVEKREIADRDRILFLASENSITSDECQQELTLGITKRQERLSDPTRQQIVRDIFVPITLDHYIWEVNENELEIRLINSEEGWNNVQIIKQRVTSDFSEIRGQEVSEAFERKVDDEIMPALKKRQKRPRPARKQ